MGIFENFNPQSAITEGIGAVAQLVGQGARHRHEKALNERTIEAQKNASQFEWDKNLEQWNRANEYNAPTEQMMRLKEAGLNPAMIYGSGGAKTTAAVSPKYQAPRPTYNYSPPADPTQMLSQYNDFRMKNAQVDLIRAQAESARAQADVAPEIWRDKKDMSFMSRFTEKSKYRWMREMGGGRSNQWRMLDTSLQSQEMRNKLTGQMITGQANRNSLLDLDLEYYLYNRFGAMAGKLAKTAISKGKNLLKRPTVKGISDKFKTPTPQQRWMKNSIMDQYPSTKW